MRIIHKDLENNQIKLLTENLNDLWHLQHIISPGDVVVSMTWRRPKSETDKFRPERREKERVKLSLRVKKVEFRKFSNELRVLGEIVKGPDIGEHHSIKIDTDSKFTLLKEWKSDHLDRLREAREASKRPKMLLAALDDERATFGLVRQYGLEKLGEITSSASGKMYESNRRASESEYYQKICDFIQSHMKSKGTSSVIVAGPGFAKKEVYSLLKDEYPEIASKTHLGNTSTPGESGLNEIIRRGIVKRVLDEDRMSMETELVEKMMKEVSKNGKATYGREKVEKAARAGAIDKLLVSDEVLKKKREEVEPIIERARGTGSDIFMISSEHEAGNQLARMGGLGALLRYSLG
ncbi:hypothetical protein AKJ63_01820 [candidate division MSBL1 archaeon SCGC-AAA259D18]|uniref:Protein pelota homolog n=1 Tax=candidate division MSBL1 archaeon SCGC-AAA259D18 TaxID=1698262 RepID=A0A133UAH3_9EURY|nr:hypothetical protein AKJ63_01820 [candidate division MSBL1 archaeon SCGC-AAA259D18]